MILKDWVNITHQKAATWELLIVEVRNKHSVYALQKKCQAAGDDSAVQNPIFYWMDSEDDIEKKEWIWASLFTKGKFQTSTVKSAMKSDKGGIQNIA